MLSAETWKYVALTFNSGYFLKFYSSRFIRKKGRFEFVIGQNRHFVKRVTFLMMLVNVGTLCAYTVIATFYIHILQLKILVGVLILLQFLFVGFQFWHWRYMSELSFLVYKFVRFYNFLCKYSCKESGETILSYD